MPKQRDQTKEFVKNLIDNNVDFKNALLHNKCYNRFIICVCDHIKDFEDNHRKTYIHLLQQLLKQKDYAKIIILSFPWNKTKDGEYYWYRIYNKIKCLNES